MMLNITRHSLYPIEPEQIDIYRSHIITNVDAPGEGLPVDCEVETNWLRQLPTVFLNWNPHAS